MMSPFSNASSPASVGSKVYKALTRVIMGAEAGAAVATDDSGSDEVDDAAGL